MANIADGLSKVSKPEVIQRSISYFANADKDYGARLAKAVKDRQK